MGRCHERIFAFELLGKARDHPVARNGVVSCPNRRRHRARAKWTALRELKRNANEDGSYSLRVRSGDPWPAVVAGCDRDDERDLVGPSAPTLSAVDLALLADHHGIIHLDAAVQFARGLALGHDVSELLAHQPGRVPFDVDLARKRQGRDRVLRLRDEAHRLEPLRQRIERVREDRTGLERGLAPAVAAVIEPASTHDRVVSTPALWTQCRQASTTSVVRPHIALPSHTVSGTRKGSSRFGIGSDCVPPLASTCQRITQ